MNKRQKEILQNQLKQEQEVLKKLKKSYQNALESINEELLKLMARVQEEPMGAQNVIYQIQYQRQLKANVEGILAELSKESTKTINEHLENSYTDSFIGTMYDLHGQGVPLVLPIDKNEVHKALTNNVALSKGLYNHLNISTVKTCRSIQRNLSSGLAQGQSYIDIARAIERDMMGNRTKGGGGLLAYADRIARTEGHRVQNQATLDAQYKAKQNGADVVKQWDATLDGKTRQWHAAADGQIKEVGEAFEVGGELMQAPGIGGSARNVCNCRCALLQRARWALDRDELNTLKERAEYFGLDKTKSFEEFRKKYNVAALKLDLQMFARKNDTYISKSKDKKILKKNIQKYGYSYEEVEQWKDYFDKEFAKGVKDPLGKTIYNRQDRYVHLAKHFAKTGLSEKYVDEVIDGIENPKEIYSTKDINGAISRCYFTDYIDPTNSQKKLCIFARNDIITAYHMEKDKIKKLKGDGRFIWKK